MACGVRCTRVLILVSRKSRVCVCVPGCVHTRGHLPVELSRCIWSGVGWVWTSPADSKSGSSRVSNRHLPGKGNTFGYPLEKQNELGRRGNKRKAGQYGGTGAERIGGIILGPGESYFTIPFIPLFLTCWLGFTKPGNFHFGPVPLSLKEPASRGPRNYGGPCVKRWERFRETAWGYGRPIWVLTLRGQRNAWGGAHPWAGKPLGVFFSAPPFKRLRITGL